MSTARKPLPILSRLNECFEFINGELHWRHRPREHFERKGRHTWFERKYACTKIGTLQAHGYLTVGIDMRSYYVHRIAFKMVHNCEPDYIDHIDGNKSNNKIENLRVADASLNLRNMRSGVRNKTGFKGIWKFKKGGKYGAAIRKNGVQIYLGSFDTAEAAHEAYWAEAQRIAGSFATRNVKSSPNAASRPTASPESKASHWQRSSLGR